MRFSALTGEPRKCRQKGYALPAAASSRNNGVFRADFIEQP
jgi:hypothetical protein